MPEPRNGSIPYRVGALEDRVGKIELKADGIAVLIERIKNMDEDVRTLKHAFYTFAFSVVAAAVVFAFSVLTWLR